MRAASSRTRTSCAVISPRTSMSSWVGTAAATAVRKRPRCSASGMPGRTSSAMIAALDVDGVGHQVAGEREPDRPRDRDARLLLGLVGAGTEVRGGDDVLELEQRRVGARLAGVDVEPGGSDPALLQRGEQRRLVDDAAAGGVDEDQRRLDGGELVGADDAHRLGGLRQVHRDDVGAAQQLVERDQADAHLRGAAGGDERVVGDDVHAERRQPLGHQGADPAEPDDAGGLLVQLDAGVLAALPLPLLEGGGGRRDVAGRGEQQADRDLGGADDVGLRGVDDHHAGRAWRP